MTLDQIVSDVFVREGDRYGDKTTHPPIDQPTGRGGITLPTLSDYLGRQASIGELKALSHTTARLVVRWKLEEIMAAHGFDRIPYEPLRLQLLDFAYNSGPGLAIRWFQRCLRVPRTSKIDKRTLAILPTTDLWLLNQALISARLQMIDMSTNPGGSIDQKFEEGLENRAHSFSLLAIP